jgi:hypothetical protein
VVAAGRFSELEWALQSCHDSARGCDFEKEYVLMLRAIEDGNRVQRKLPMLSFLGPAGPCWAISSPLSLCHLFLDLGNHSWEVKE